MVKCLTDVVNLVRRHENILGTAEALKYLSKVSALARVETRRRFVEEKSRRLMDKRLGDPHPTHLSA